VYFPIKNGGSFHSYVKLPEGILNVGNPINPNHPKTYRKLGDGLVDTIHLQYGDLGGHLSLGLPHTLW